MSSQPSLLFRSKGHRALGLVFLLALLPSGRCRLETPTREVTGLAIGDDLLRLGHQGRLGSWPLYGGDLAQTRFSPLRQINNTNVDRLVPRWVFHTEVYGDDTGYQTTPIVVDGEMYLTTPIVEGVQHVIKLEGRTGKEMWRTGLAQHQAYTCCGPSNRGVALYGNRVYWATLDARLVALDRHSGTIVWQRQIANSLEGYSETQAPLAYGGRVFVGVSGGDFGIRGFVKAFDAENGDLLWTWHSVPSPEEGGWVGEWTDIAPGTGLHLNRDISSEKSNVEKYPEAWKQGGGGVWMTPSLDHERGLLFVHVGNPAPDYDGTVRPGDNRWTSSVCALRVEDGRLVWGFQYLPHDVWDYAGGAAPILFEARLGDSLTDVAGFFTKMGLFYLLERDKGKLLQVSENYVPHHNFLTAPTTDGVVVAPGPGGGSSWSPGAYSALTGLVCAVASHLPIRITHKPGTQRIVGQAYLGGTPETIPGFRQKAYGLVLALDPISGKVAWRSETRVPIQSGVLVTGGGLVFAGQTDGGFRAWNAQTGASLWEYPTECGINAPSITFSIHDKQFIVVACGGSSGLRSIGFDSPAGDQILAFSLP